jgi:hypothetical protein
VKVGDLVQDKRGNICFIIDVLVPDALSWANRYDVIWLGSGHRRIVDRGALKWLKLK